MAENIQAEQKNLQLEAGAYEIIKERLQQAGTLLEEKLQQLQAERRDVFGGVETRLLATQILSTENNCLARDIIDLPGNRFIFGYNVHIGLKSEVTIADVFSIGVFDPKNLTLSNDALAPMEDDQFLTDFKNLYNYYKNTRFSKFAQIGPYLFMVFQVGKKPTDIKTFKWQRTPEGIQYIDNRSDHEFNFPQQHEFRWIKPGREWHRKGKFPHISLEDKVFIETIHGDLTIKIEDNTDTGKGIYTEPVDVPDQTLDDLEIYYAIIGNLVAIKLKPYKELTYRYFIFNIKLKEVLRMDALEDSCVLLPDDQGIIFARGYYLQTGEYKLFENQLQEMLFETKTVSPNGEDFLYTFYQNSTGTYILLSYNIISQTVNTPLICHGYSLYENGELLFLRAEDEQKKHHQIQVWQTPFYSHNITPASLKASPLVKIGNKDIVRAMSECSEVIKLLRKGDNYETLYEDLSKRCTVITDTYHWLGQKECFDLLHPLTQIKTTAVTAIEAFEKVRQIRKNTAEQTTAVLEKAAEIIKKAKRSDARNILEFVERLSLLRAVRGEIIQLKSLRYVDETLVSNAEKDAATVMEQVSRDCVMFLLRAEALQPYKDSILQSDKALKEVKTSSEASKLEETVLKISAELEMLIQIVSNLKIQDPAQSTTIIENISTVYASFNQLLSSVRNKRKQLALKEGEADFVAQMKLISQSLSNYLDISNTAAKCDDYLNKLMVQLEEVSGKFSEWEDFSEKIQTKREEIYEAFESRKIALNEALQQKTLQLQQSAIRILKGVQTRLASFKSLQEIHAWFAADIMVEKVRDTVAKLLQAGDSIKADELQSRLKTIYEEAQRQLKDKTELYDADGKVIKLGQYAFNVNTQVPDLALVSKDKKMQLHISGTQYFEQADTGAWPGNMTLWSQQLLSENHEIYRAAYLAGILMNQSLDGNQNRQNEENILSANQLLALGNEELVAYVSSKMALRYDEGYTKGIHDHDAAIILKTLLQFKTDAPLLIFNSTSRGIALLTWYFLMSEEEKDSFSLAFNTIIPLKKAFPGAGNIDSTATKLLHTVKEKAQQIWPEISETDWQMAANFLFELKTDAVEIPIAKEAIDLKNAFQDFLRKDKKTTLFENSLMTATSQPQRYVQTVLSWLTLFCRQEGVGNIAFLEECAWLILNNEKVKTVTYPNALQVQLQGLMGQHNKIQDGKLLIDFNVYFHDFEQYLLDGVPAFTAVQQHKKTLLENTKKAMRLETFMPKVMSAFVRNRLLDEVYLPLIGANLAKQMGTADQQTRTDRNGLLLLISPPGYGKTTLMEYIANRLGLVFMKINGPSIGHNVVAVDPESAPHSAAREELLKLNLSFEMGDNVMIYIDDIQHLNPEFLQKFISLCDAQRKIEGSYKGVGKTYDFRGKKVAVVMAGNPYTESGEKFKIPDMLANRADIYNLGDIVGGKAEAFKDSYVENALTSHPILQKLAQKSHKDVMQVLQWAKTGQADGLQLEAQHSAPELDEYHALMQKLLAVREIVLKVNEAYIYSAGQAEEFRNEPPFRLQGSYRNMNKLTERLHPMMNEEELRTLILSHYENESQTLTTGAEYNFLKFKQLIGVISEEENIRLQDINAIYVRNLRLKGMGNNQMAQMLDQMEVLNKTLQNIGLKFRSEN